MPMWAIWTGLAVLGGYLLVRDVALAWPPNAIVNQSIVSSIQQQNPSVDVNRLNAWLAQAPAWYASTTSTPSVNGYVQWVVVNTPAWAGGAPVTTSPLYNATYATAG